MGKKSFKGKQFTLKCSSTNALVSKFAHVLGQDEGDGGDDDDGGGRRRRRRRLPSRDRPAHGQVVLVALVVVDVNQINPCLKYHHG